MIIDKPELDTSFTSTGEKLFYHQELLEKLRNGSGMPVSAWIAPTDVCNAKCSFCSVGERAGDVLPFGVIKGFIDQLVPLGLKSVTLSGGGNPLLYKCKLTGMDINDVVDYIHRQGVQVAMITNGMPLADYSMFPGPVRRSWKNMHPDTLDKLTWCRISMAGLDHNHKEQQVYVPDFDPDKTTLGFSWIMSDSYEEPSHKHGWVSTPEDIKWTRPNEQREYWANPENPTLPLPSRKAVFAVDRLPWIEEQIASYVEKHNPKYVRLLCNCLQPDLIPERHRMLQDMAERINPQIVFSQNKPPRQPKKCFKVMTRPCLNADSFVYPCDSTVLNRTAGHKFGSLWRICRWDQVAELYADPSKFDMPEGICPGCVFAQAVDLINDAVHGAEFPVPSGEAPQHINYI